jgi:hypothetical protein
MDADGVTVAQEAEVSASRGRVRVLASLGLA